MEEAVDMFKLLESSAKIDRNKGVDLLKQFLETTDATTGQSIELAVLGLLSKTGVSWETKHGALMGAEAILSHPTYHLSMDDFEAKAKDHAMQMLEDLEYRVRLAAGDLVGALCKNGGCQMYEDIRETVFDGIKKNLDDDDERSHGADRHCPLSPSSKSSSSESHSTSAEEIFSGTTKWKHLETWLKCLQCIVEGCGQSFNSQINPELLDLMTSAVKNWSRFVREACAAVLGALISSNVSKENAMMVSEDVSGVYRFADVFSNQLAALLSDDHSEVRMAASVAVRKFLLGCPDNTVKQSCLAILLPSLCFNRYYAAEGVRLYSQETWMLVTSGEGRRLVELNFDSVVAFDITQLNVNNHEVRETACTCIREMAQKISSSAFEPYVTPLLTALRDCLRSGIWTVRDVKHGLYHDIAYYCLDRVIWSSALAFMWQLLTATLVTCGEIISLFPDQSKALVESLKEYFFIGLEDNTPPVREAAAIALGCTVKAYGIEMLPAIIAKIKASLEGVALEKTDEERRLAVDLTRQELEASPHEAEINCDTKLLLGHGTELHLHGAAFAQRHSQASEVNVSVQAMKNQRPSELWELADGCLCLMCELAQQPAFGTEVTKLLPALATAASFNHYSQHVFFLQSVCKQLPVLFKNLGKRPLKLYAEIFFDVIFGAVASDKHPVSTAANECIARLSELLGPSIFHARVESYNPRYLQYLGQTDADGTS